MSFNTKMALTLMVLIVFISCKKDEAHKVSVAGSSAHATTSSANSEATVQQSSTGDVGKVLPQMDACALLTSSDIESVQREAVKEVKLSGSFDGGLSVSQCFFVLPTFTNSISLQLTQKGQGAGARDPREFWNNIFHGERKMERERERGQEEVVKKEEDEKEPAPQRVSGVGDEAFWLASHVGGTLYVLKGPDYLRISVGGAGKDKIAKSKALAQKVLTRL